MLIKTLLNKVDRFKSFVYGSICVTLIDGVEALVVDIEPRRNSRPICPECCKRRRVYDRQPQRLFEYLPVWTFKSYYRYAPRRVDCPSCGVKAKGSSLTNGDSPLFLLLVTKTLTVPRAVV